MTKYKTLMDLPSNLVLTLACYALGGAKRKIYSEEIMFKAFEWNKVKYSWTLNKFNKFPDGEGLRKALFAARTGGLVVGAYARNISKDGWSLTKKGIEVSLDNKHLINSKSSKITLNQFEKKLLRDLRKSNLVQLLDNNEINIYHLAELFEVPAGNNEILRTKFNELLRLSIVDEDTKTTNLLNRIKNYEKFQIFLDDELFFKQQKARYRKAK